MRMQQVASPGAPDSALNRRGGNMCVWDASNQFFAERVNRPVLLSPVTRLQMAVMSERRARGARAGPARLNQEVPV